MVVESSSLQGLVLVLAVSLQSATPTASAFSVITPWEYPILGNTTADVQSGTLAPTAEWVYNTSGSGGSDTLTIFSSEKGREEWGGIGLSTGDCGGTMTQINETFDLPQGTALGVGLDSVMKLEPTKYHSPGFSMYCGGWYRRNGGRMSALEFDMKCSKNPAAGATFKPARTVKLSNWWTSATVDLEPYFLPSNNNPGGGGGGSAGSMPSSGLGGSGMPSGMSGMGNGSGMASFSAPSGSGSGSTGAMEQQEEPIYDEWVHVKIPMTDFQSQEWNAAQIESISFWLLPSATWLEWPSCNITNVLFNANRTRKLGTTPPQVMAGKQRSRVVWVGRIAPRIISVAFDVVPNEIEPADWSTFPYEVNGKVLADLTPGKANVGRFSTTRFQGNARNDFPLIMRHEIFLRVPESAFPRTSAEATATQAKAGYFEFVNITTPMGVLDAAHLNDDTKCQCLSLSSNMESYTGRVGKQRRAAILSVYAGDLSLDDSEQGFGVDYYSNSTSWSVVYGERLPEDREVATNWTSAKVQWEANVSTPYTLPTDTVLTGTFSSSSSSTEKLVLGELFNGTSSWSGSQSQVVNISGVPNWWGVPFRVQVDGCGVSLPFSVGNVAQQARVHYRGLFHQRCNQELSSEFTDWPRAACHMDLTATREAEPAGMINPSNWPVTGNATMISGGYHDAGDYDRRPYHTLMPPQLLSGYEFFGTASNVSTGVSVKEPDGDQQQDSWLGIPESGNGFADSLDEALYSLKVFIGLQNMSVMGCVRAGAEGPAHPTYGEVHAANDTLAYSTYRFDTHVTAMASGMFAQAARLLLTKTNGALSDSAYHRSLATELQQRAWAAWGCLRNAYDGAGTNTTIATDNCTDVSTQTLFAASQLLQLARTEGASPEFFEPKPWVGNLTVVEAAVELNATIFACFKDGGVEARSWPKQFSFYFNGPLMMQGMPVVSFFAPFIGHFWDASQRQWKNFTEHSWVEADANATSMLELIDFHQLEIAKFLQSSVLGLADAVITHLDNTASGTGYPFPVGSSIQGWGATMNAGRYGEALIYAFLFTEGQGSEEFTTPQGEVYWSPPAKALSYLDAASAVSDLPLGLNPTRRSFTTGLGNKELSPGSPLHSDSYPFQMEGLPPVEGITVYGVGGGGSNMPAYRVVKEPVFPAWDTLPFLRRYTDGWTIIDQNEFTTWETMVNNAVTYMALSVLDGPREFSPIPRPTLPPTPAPTAPTPAPAATPVPATPAPGAATPSPSATPNPNGPTPNPGQGTGGDPSSDESSGGVPKGGSGGSSEASSEVFSASSSEVESSRAAGGLSIPTEPPAPGGIPYVRGRFKLSGTKYGIILANPTLVAYLKGALRRDLSRLFRCLIRFVRIDALEEGSLVVDYTLTTPAVSVEEADAAVANSDEEGGFSATQDTYGQSTGSSETITVTESSTSQGTTRGKSACGTLLSSFDCAVALSVGGGTLFLILVVGVIMCVKSHFYQGRKAAERKRVDEEKQRLTAHDAKNQDACPSYNQHCDNYGDGEEEKWPAEAAEGEGSAANLQDEEWYWDGNEWQRNPEYQENPVGDEELWGNEGEETGQFQQEGEDGGEWYWDGSEWQRNVEYQQATEEYQEEQDNY